MCWGGNCASSLRLKNLCFIFSPLSVNSRMLSSSPLASATTALYTPASFLVTWVTVSLSQLGMNYSEISEVKLNYSSTRGGTDLRNGKRGHSRRLVHHLRDLYTVLIPLHLRVLAHVRHLRERMQRNTSKKKKSLANYSSFINWISRAVYNHVSDVHSHL